MKRTRKPSPAKLAGTRRSRFKLDVTRLELILLQDAMDDYSRDAGAGAKGDRAKRQRALQRKLHKPTGETMPSTPAADRAYFRRLLKKHGGK
jgi:hypothetical protein